MISIIMVKLFLVCHIKNIKNLNKSVVSWITFLNYINFTLLLLIPLMTGEICFGLILIVLWLVIGWMKLKNSRNNVLLFQKILKPGKLMLYLNNKLMTIKKSYLLSLSLKNHLSKIDIGKLLLKLLEMISLIHKRKISSWIIFSKLKSFQILKISKTSPTQLINK
jgi:hypothetical protein